MSRALTPGSHGAGHTAGDLDHKSSRELSGGRPMGIQLGSKIHLFYNCPPDVFIDPRIRRAGGVERGEEDLRRKRKPSHVRKIATSFCLILQRPRSTPGQALCLEGTGEGRKRTAVPVDASAVSL